MIEEIKNIEHYDKILLKNRYVVVDFYAQWCGPCKRLAPEIEKMVHEFGNVKFLKVDIDVAADVAEKCNIQQMPTILFYESAENVAEVAGAEPEKIRATLRNLLKSS